MILDDLRTGDIVQFRNGMVYLVSAAPDSSDGAPYRFYSCDKGGNRFDFAEFNIDMRHQKNNAFDVMNVLTSGQPYCGSDWMFSLIRKGSKEISKQAVAIDWTWQRDKEDELRKEKRKAIELSTELEEQLKIINQRLLALEKHETIRGLIKLIVNEIKWNEWEVTEILESEGE